MNRYRVKVLFDYFDKEHYSNARKVVEKYPHALRIDDDYPAFWVWIDTKDRATNVKYAKMLLDEVNK